MKESKKICIFIILISVLFCVIRIFKIEQKTMSCDKAFHIGRFQELADEIKENGLLKYPYYINYEAFNNMGYATEMFYGDFFLIIPACLSNITGVSIHFIYSFTVAFSILAIFVSMYFAYRVYYKSDSNKMNALFISVIYTFSSFIIFEILERNALGTNFAYMFLPWIVFSAINIIKADNHSYRDSIVLGVTMAGMILSHLQTFIVTVIGLFIYVLINIFKILKNKNCIKKLIVSVIICIGLDAFFVFPMLEQICYQKLYIHNSSEIKLEDTVPAHLNLFFPNYYWINFFMKDYVFRDSEALNNIIRYWTLPSCFFPYLYMIITSIKLRKKEKNQSIKFIWFCILCSVLILISSFTLLICKLEFLSFLQFPWRLLTIAVMFLPIGFMLANKENDVIKIVAVILTLVNIIMYITMCEKFNLSYKDYPTIGNGEYLPVEIPNSKYGYYRIENHFDVSWERTGYKLNLKENSNISEENVELPIVYYKGYKVYNNNIEIDFCKSKNGLIQIKNAKITDLKVIYKGTKIQKISKYISINTFIVICVVIGSYIKKRWNKNYINLT